jgi:predicted ATPase
LAITHLHVEGYRSVKDVWLKLERINVLVGPNGCGKSNLYRSMFLLASAAQGQFARTIADEGGMPSILWAGDRSKGPVRLTLSVRVDNIKYDLSVGLPEASEMTPFPLDPRIKEEQIDFVNGASKTNLLKRTKGTINARDTDGKKLLFPMALTDSESVLSGLREPHRFPEISALRQEFLNWRFYHQFRTDYHSPLRRPQTGVFTPILAHDGSDLAAALLTISEWGDGESLEEGITQAFPGAALKIGNQDGQLTIELQMPDFRRPFNAKELSDGTLQYLCLLAALLSFRPPSLLALNEPETSIHPDLFESLAKLIAKASQHSQLWITTHSHELADFILEHTGAAPIELQKINGATEVVGARLSNDED